MGFIPRTGTVIAIDPDIEKNGVATLTHSKRLCTVSVMTSPMAFRFWFHEKPSCLHSELSLLLVMVFCWFNFNLLNNSTVEMHLGFLHRDGTTSNSTSCLINCSCHSFRYFACSWSGICDAPPTALWFDIKLGNLFYENSLGSSSSKAVSKDYQRISVGSTTFTRGPMTSNSSPNWQLHQWQSGTMYHLWLVELANWTWAPSVAGFKHPTLWQILAFCPVAFSQYRSQLPFRPPSLKLWTLYIII